MPGLDLDGAPVVGKTGAECLAEKRWGL